MTTTTRYPIRFSRFNAALMSVLGMSPRHSYVEADDDELRVRMGVGFRATIPLTSVVEVGKPGRVWWGWGVHGWRGRWLVNGSGLGMVRLRIDPPVPARVLGLPVKLRDLWVSLDDPDGFLAAIGR